MDDTRTSEPGAGTDRLEPDFEQQLANEGLELEGRELPKPVKPVDQPKPEAPKPPEPPKEEPKPEDKKPTMEDGKPEKPKGETWRQAIATKRQEQEKAKDQKIADLEKENATLKNPKTPIAPLNPADPPAPAEKSVLTDEQKNLAEKYGIEPEDYLKMFPSKVIEKEVIKSGLTPEQTTLLDTLQSDREKQSINDGFRTDFEDNVLPLIKAEYPNISDEKVKEIKSKIFEKIKTDEFSLTPLTTLYKGEDDFRGVVTTPKKSFDEGNKVPSNSGNKVYDFENVSDADMKNSDFPFEKYSEYMASKEKGAKRN